MARETRVGYKPDHKSFGEFMLSEQARQPAIEAARDIAKLAAENSRAAAGGGTHDSDGVSLADNYKVNEHTAPVIVGGNPRVGAEVYNDKRYAAAQEFGTGHRRRRGTRALRRAGAAVGELRGDIG